MREREDANRTREAGSRDEVEGVVANRLNLFREGNIGFIDWLGRTAALIIVVADPGGFDKSPGKRVLE